MLFLLNLIQRKEVQFSNVYENFEKIHKLSQENKTQGEKKIPLYSKELHTRTQREGERERKKKERKKEPS